MTYTQYPKYKDSGIEWLGEIPENWEVKRLKYTSTINDEALSETTDPAYEFLYVDIGNVEYLKGICSKEPQVFEKAPSRARRIVRDGDTIIPTVRTYLRAIAPIRKPEDNLIVSTGFAVVRPWHINSNYLSYALQSPYFVETVVSRSTGVSYPAINAPEIGMIPILIPALDIQRAIAAFLDRETARIDILTEKKQKQIELLQEKRSALISHAVTKGLDPNVKMKDSGIEWLGEIPEGWEAVPLKRVFRILNGSTPKSGEPSFWDGDIPWVTPDDLGDLKSDTLLNTQRMITEEGYNSCGTSLAPTGSLVLSTRAPIGHLAIAGIPFCTNQGCRCLVFRNKDNHRFYYYQLLVAKQELESWGQGSTFKEIGRDKLGAVSLLNSPFDEQRSIAAFLDQETARIDALLEKVRESIEKLREYRTALISAAVTGKIDVRGEAA